MVVEVDAHQTSLEPFVSSSWPSRMHHSDDAVAGSSSSSARYLGLSKSAPASPPSNILDVLITSGSSTSRPRVCEPSKSGPPSPAPRPKAAKAKSAPRVLRSSSVPHRPREERTGSSTAITPPPGDHDHEDPRTTPAAARPNGPDPDPDPDADDDIPRPRPSAAASPAKRARAAHDVDGPGTAALACKKRRLGLRLVTSRLSRPYSLPATHIVHGRPLPFLRLAAAVLGASRGSRRGAALVRKAAILNRVRIVRGYGGVGVGALGHGHGHGHGHGLQVVVGGLGIAVHGTGAAVGTGARFPGRGVGIGVGAAPMPLAWRPHSTAAAVAAPWDASTTMGRGDRAGNTGSGASEAHRASYRPPARDVLGSPAPSHTADAVSVSSVGEEDDDTAFPARSLDTGSDDDMDVYADFGVLFGPGGGGGGGASDEEKEEYFYEEYLDELDGIPWTA
ncbi:hypothetical protein F4779DRAFT_633011 [Xylariaceae sp. FL0662B]|nr:hypothetical protein F4779DRAFT_633011 [Xylariaceae sp. FL0662B]